MLRRVTGRRFGAIWNSAGRRFRLQSGERQMRRSRREHLDRDHVQTKRTINFVRPGFCVAGMLVLGRVVRRRVNADDVRQNFRIAVKAQCRKRGRYHAEQHRKQCDTREKTV